MFLHVSVCPQGEYLGRYPPGTRYTPWKHTPQEAHTHTPGSPLKHPPGKHTPGRQLMLWTVCILLECILVVDEMEFDKTKCSCQSISDQNNTKLCQRVVGVRGVEVGYLGVEWVKGCRASRVRRCRRSRV